MIRVNDTYYIQVEDNQFTVLKKGLYNSGKNAGKIKYDPIGYYSSLQKSIEAVRTRLQVDNLKGESDTIISLSEAIERLQTADNAFRRLLEDIPKVKLN